MDSFRKTVEEIRCRHAEDLQILIEQPEVFHRYPADWQSALDIKYLLEVVDNLVNECDELNADLQKSLQNHACDLTPGDL